MNPGEPAREIARAETARGEVVLRGRDDGAIELRVNGVFVMDTVETSTEVALAEVALAQVARPTRVVIGGLGLGFTLHAVLGDRRVGEVRVIEIEDALIGWMRDGTVPHGPEFLADERVTVVEHDVAVAITELDPGSVDLLLLDVDNGPDYLVYAENAGVYTDVFLTSASRCLAPDGSIAIWSATESADLLAALTRSFGNARPVAFDVDLQGRSEQYWLHLARGSRNN